MQRSIHMPRSILEECAVKVSSSVQISNDNALQSPIRQPRRSGVNPLNSTSTCLCGGGTAKKSMLDEEHDQFV